MVSFRGDFLGVEKNGGGYLDGKRDSIKRKKNQFRAL